jgi:hypothetical protein
MTSLYGNLINGPATELDPARNEFELTTLMGQEIKNRLLSKNSRYHFD